MATDNHQNNNEAENEQATAARQGPALRNLRHERPISMPLGMQQMNTLEGMFATAKWPPIAGVIQERPTTASPVRSFISRKTGQVDLAGFNFALASPEDLRRALHQALSDLTAVKEESDLMQKRLIQSNATNKMAINGDPSVGNHAHSPTSPHLSHELSETLRRVGDLKLMLNQSDTELDKTRAELDRVKHERNNTVERLTADMQTLTDTLQDMTEELTKCREDLRESQNETDKVREWSEGFWAERDRLIDEIEQLRTEHPELKEILSRLGANESGSQLVDEEEEEELDEDLQAVLGVRTREEVALEQVGQEIQTLEEKLSRPSSSLTSPIRIDLERQLSEARQEQEQLQLATNNSKPLFALSPRHQRTMSDIDSFITELETDLSSSQQEIVFLKRQLSGETGRRELELVIADTQKQLEERNAQLLVVQHELKELQDKVAINTTSNVPTGPSTATTAATATATTAKDKLPLNTEKPRSIISPSDSAIMVTRDQYDDLDERRAELDIRCTELEIAVVGLEEERNRWNRERSEIEEELHELEKQRGNWSEERERLKAEIADKEAAHNEMDKNRETLEREIKILREEKVLLEERISAASNIDLDKADDTVLELDPEWRLRIQILYEEKINAEQQAQQAQETRLEAEKTVEQVQAQMKKLENEKRMLVED
ncbi:hypothetical protein BDF19DRAFT_214008 [Syncephalis fuscata]|nr:hypothetical protein BDF19DRAFT_214008 [Syncephalis fuscata]